MANDVGSMTNAELQSKLTDYGFPKVPVTSATRKVLEKKLKSLLEKGKPTVHKEEEKVQPGASAYNDQGGNTPLKQKEKNRRRTTMVKTQDIVESKKDSPIIEDTKVIPSTMVKVEEMSNEDLRKKLTEHGYPLMPVTAATRGLLEKKLKSILYGSKMMDTTDSKDKKPLIAVELKMESKTKRSRHTIASEDDSKVNVDKKQSNMDELNLEATKNKTKRSRYTIASEDVFNIDSNYERPQKICRLSAQSPTCASSSTENPSDTLSSIRSAFSTNSPLGSQTTRPKYDFNISNSVLDSQESIDRIEYPIRNSISNRLDLSKPINVEQSTTDRKSQSFIDKLNSFSKLTSISSFAKTSSPSSYHPNINFSTNQPSTSELDNSNSPFLSEFGRRLHAEKLRAKTNSN